MESVVFFLAHCPSFESGPERSFGVAELCAERAIVPDIWSTHWTVETVVAVQLCHMLMFRCGTMASCLFAAATDLHALHPNSPHKQVCTCHSCTSSSP